MTLEDKNVPVTVAEIQPTEENTIGIDLGVENYVALSTGEMIEHPRFFGIVGMDIASLKSALGLNSKRSQCSTRLGGASGVCHEIDIISLLSGKPGS